jgi:hypothetical protein|tara:strand:- start:749 stop:1177 length:429 start_codon:yes stop_codon:yes gene_type:complete
MAFNPYGTDYNVRSPIATSPSQRLAAALAKTTYGQKNAQRTATSNRFDLSKSIPKNLRKMNAGYGVRGLQNSGIRQSGLSDYLTGVDRTQAGISSALDEALFNLTVENTGAYDAYFGSRYGQEFDAATGRAEIAATIRENTY